MPMNLNEYTDQYGISGIEGQIGELARSRDKHRDHWRLGNWKVKFYQLNTRAS